MQNLLSSVRGVKIMDKGFGQLKVKSKDENTRKLADEKKFREKTGEFLFLLGFSIIASIITTIYTKQNIDKILSFFGKIDQVTFFS